MIDKILALFQEILNFLKIQADFKYIVLVWNSSSFQDLREPCASKITILQVLLTGDEVNIMIYFPYSIKL